MYLKFSGARLYLYAGDGRLETYARTLLRANLRSVIRRMSDQTRHLVDQAHRSRKSESLIFQGGEWRFRFRQRIDLKLVNTSSYIVVIDEMFGRQARIIRHFESRSTFGETVSERSLSPPPRNASLTTHPLTLPRRKTSRLTTRCTTTSPR